MKKLLLAVLALSLVAVFTAGCAGNQSSVSGNYDDVIITLERTACFGTCPVYTLTMNGDGTVIYEGKDFVKTKGRVEATISQDQIEQLISLK